MHLDGTQMPPYLNATKMVEGNSITPANGASPMTTKTTSFLIERAADQAGPVFFLALGLAAAAAVVGISI